MTLRHGFDWSVKMTFSVMRYVVDVVRPQLHGYVFKSFRFHFVAFSNRSIFDCVFKCLFAFSCEQEVISLRFQMKTYPCHRGQSFLSRQMKHFSL